MDNFPDYNSTAEYKKIDGGLSLGIGTEIILNDNKFSIELRENLGFINISNVENSMNINGEVDDITIKTNSLNLVLTWYFNI